MRIADNTNDSSVLDFTNKMKAIIKEIFEMKSIDGINIAGKTSKLDSIYINLLRFSQVVISQDKFKYIHH